MDFFNQVINPIEIKSLVKGEHMDPVETNQDAIFHPIKMKKLWNQNSMIFYRLFCMGHTISLTSMIRQEVMHLNCIVNSSVFIPYSFVAP